ncbi:MAG: helix-turn-helix domain-containing protein, partial [Candidatus Wukongarchaeota archaeon]|nr:ATP-binding protein [Candidatus Wukongarchaeota archaeon]
MGFIDKFFRKKPEDVTKEDLEAFLTRKIEENLNLDYKTIQAYYDFDELSKDVSAFANSEGGLLILGFSQDEIKKGKAVVKVLPKELTWGEEALSKERLEDNLVGKIQPRIDGIKIQPVREGNGSMRVIFLVDIPQSKNRPHMASDKRYYKRLNFRKTPMEHFEIVNLLKVRWVLNERIIEKIYEPLASILEKNSKEFSNYQSPNTRE